MGKKVLVVDDEKDISTLIKINLEKAGYEVITLNKSTEALKKTKEEKPDVITLDIMMPEMDGFQVLDSLKKDPETKDIPVIMVSVISNIHKEQVFRAGAVDFVTKPIDFRNLINMVSSVISRCKDYKSGKKQKIAVVDDEPDTANLIKKVLSENGFTVSVFFSGSDALENIKNKEYDIVILDLYMPGTDGFTVLENLRKQKETEEIPVIVLTGHDSKGCREKCFFLGASEYMTKPFSAEKFISEIKKCLHKI